MNLPKGFINFKDNNGVLIVENYYYQINKQIALDNSKINTRIIMVCLFCVSFASPFRYVINQYLGIPVTLIIYSPILLLVSYCLLSKQIIKINNFMLFIAAYCLLTTFWSSDFTSGFQWFINIIFGIILGSLFADKKFEDKHLISFTIGTIICNIMLLPKIVTKLPFHITNMSLIRIPTIKGDIEVGPNGWANLLSFSLIILLFLYDQNKIKKIVFYLLAGLTIYFLVLTRSQTNLYCIYLILGMFFFIRAIRSKRRIKWWGILFVVILLFFLYYLPKIIDETTNIYDFDLNGRVEIWGGAVDIFLNKLNVLQMIFGCGAGSTGEILFNNWSYTYGFRITGDHLSSHSTYLDCLFSIGIFGTVMYIGFWFYMLIKLLKYKDKAFYLFPMYVLISGIPYHVFGNWYYSLLLALSWSGILYMNSKKSNPNNSEKMCGYVKNNISTKHF